MVNPVHSNRQWITTAEMVYISLFAALTAVSSIISIPIGPVPITLQVVFVLLSGAVLGRLGGPLSMVIYLLLGIIGLPVFAGGTSGIGHLLGPTGGYLFGFVAASFVVGLLSSGERRFFRNLPPMAAALAVLYALGVLWLSVSTNMGLKKAIAVGMLPFIPVDAVKTLIAAYLASLWPRRPGRNK